MATPPTDLPVVAVACSWEEAFAAPARASLEQALPAFLRQRRWFGGKARAIKAVRIQGAFRFPFADSVAFLTLIAVEFDTGAAETYLLPLTFADDSTMHGVVRLTGGVEGVLVDALGSAAFNTALLQGMAANQHCAGDGGATLTLSSFAAFDTYRGGDLAELTPSLSRAEQSNTSVIYGQRLMLKVFRKVSEGINPDLEIGRYLTERAPGVTAALCGAIEYRVAQAEPMTLGILQAFVPNQGDAWKYTLDVLADFYKRALAFPNDPAAGNQSLMELASAALTAQDEQWIGPFADTARLLGRRTAEMHLALAAPTDDPAFAAEPFTTEYQRSACLQMASLKDQVLHQLRQRQSALPATAQPEARQLLALEDRILARFERLRDGRITALRTRWHGDYHLGQVLWTGQDFVIIDFEGEPLRSLNARRIKRLPLRDVAGMVRSFHYAAYSGLAVTAPRLEPWARFWYSRVSAAYLKSYLDTAGAPAFLPQTREEFAMLLEGFLLEKAVYELGYELNHRPDWVRIPLLGILHLLNASD